jgi:uncharacterized protein (TIGR02996 family)
LLRSRLWAFFWSSQNVGRAAIESSSSIFRRLWSTSKQPPELAHFLGQLLQLRFDRANICAFDRHRSDGYTTGVPAATTESELLAALRRAPGDANALHVYADWLLERGDTRGELLLLQQREATLADAPSLERLLQLVAEHGYLVLPDDPEADILRFRGGTHHHEGSNITIEYRLARAGRTFHVVDTPAIGRLAIAVDDDVVRTDMYGNKSSWPKLNFMNPETANVVLALISRAILDDTPWPQLEFPTGHRLTSHPAYRVGRFPTEPVPRELVALWPHADGWEIERRDLDRWRMLLRRWYALRG